MFAVLSVSVLALTLAQLGLYLDAMTTSSSFDPTRIETLPRLHGNAIHVLWLLSVVVAVVLTIAYASTGAARVAAVAAAGMCCVGVSVWTTPLRPGHLDLPGVVRPAQLAPGAALCAVAIATLVVAYMAYRRSTRAV